MKFVKFVVMNIEEITDTIDVELALQCCRRWWLEKLHQSSLICVFIGPLIYLIKHKWAVSTSFGRLRL